MVYYVIAQTINWTNADVSSIRPLWMGTKGLARLWHVQELRVKSREMPEQAIDEEETG